MTKQDRFKFRVWYTPNYEDVKPCYVYDVEQLYDGFINNDFSDELGWASSFGTLLDSPEQFIIEQCTGIKDKNGKLIYEGDIVDIKGHIDSVNGKYIVEWSDVCHCWNLRSIFKNSWGDSRCFSFSELNYFNETSEVIGNIHEENKDE